MKNYQVRVIGGRWRGRRIDFPHLEGIRPTPDRVRETVFNWLMHEIVGANCLDAFAGSGALGIEALSRGAKEVVFIDQSSEVVKSIKATLTTLSPELKSYQVLMRNTQAWLEKTPATPFDVVFLDPPFSQEYLATCLVLLLDNGWLGSGAIIYLEHEVGWVLPEALAPRLTSHRSQTVGEVVFSLYRIEDTF